VIAPGELPHLHAAGEQLLALIGVAGVDHELVRAGQGVGENHDFDAAGLGLGERLVEVAGDDEVRRFEDDRLLGAGDELENRFADLAVAAQALAAVAKESQAADVRLVGGPCVE